MALSALFFGMSGLLVRYKTAYEGLPASTVVLVRGIIRYWCSRRPPNVRLVKKTLQTVVVYVATYLFVLGCIRYLKQNAAKQIRGKPEVNATVSMSWLSTLWWMMYLVQKRLASATYANSAFYRRRTHGVGRQAAQGSWSKPTEEATFLQYKQLWRDDVCVLSLQREKGPGQYLTCYITFFFGRLGWAITPPVNYGTTLHRPFLCAECSSYLLLHQI